MLNWLRTSRSREQVQGLARLDVAVENDDWVVVSTSGADSPVLVPSPRLALQDPALFAGHDSPLAGASRATSAASSPRRHAATADQGDVVGAAPAAPAAVLARVNPARVRLAAAAEIVAQHQPMVRRPLTGAGNAAFRALVKSHQPRPARGKAARKAMRQQSHRSSFNAKRHV